MIKFTVYRISDGFIRSTGNCNDVDQWMQAQDGELVWVGEQIDGDVFYLPDGVVTERPSLPISAEYTIAADGVDAVEFPLPAGSVVVARALALEWTDEDEFYFSTETPGTTVFHLMPAFPYREIERFEVHAV